MKIGELYNLFLQSTGVNTDTRKIEPGNMYFALRGEQFNGNLFVKQALDRGALYAVVDEPEAVINENCLLVSDTLATLQQLANFHRRQFTIPFIAITGSNGKTTTKELIAKALGAERNVFYTPGNFNNHIGVPLSLLMLTPEHEMAVIEMGANHPGEIAELCQIACPDSGLITNIGKDHLEGFGSLEGSAEANAELFDFLESRQGTAFINTGDEWNLRLQARVTNRFTYPAATDDAPCTRLPSGFFLHIAVPGLAPVQTQVTGLYNFHNLACALAVAKFYGISASHALQGVAAYAPANNRSQVIRSQANTLIADAYNANPSSVLAAVENLRNLETDHRFAILGDMLELGTDSAKEHSELGAWCATIPEITFLVTGPEMKSFSASHPGASYFEHKADLEVWLRVNPIRNAIVLLKGSRGMKLETLLPLL